MSASSLLIDVMSTEIRIRIYKEVLRSEHGLVPVHPDFEDEVRHVLFVSYILDTPATDKWIASFDISLLTTCKLIHSKAFDVFFEINAIRFWRRCELDRAVKQNLGSINFVRYLEIVHIMCEWHWLQAKDLKCTIDTCQALPKIKSLPIAYDALGTSSSLRELPTTSKINNELRCVDIGVYKLDDASSIKVCFKHYGMVNAWQEFQRREAVDLNAVWTAAITRFGWRSGLPSNGMICQEVARHLDLPGWCAVYEASRRRRELSKGRGSPRKGSRMEGRNRAAVYWRGPCALAGIKGQSEVGRR